jgi:hypothetical protein
MSDIITRDARLIIVRELAAQPGYSLNEALLSETLQSFGITRSRDWLRDELRALAELGAVTVTEIGTVKVAVLTNKGLDHVERRIVIEGIKRPSPPRE